MWNIYWNNEKVSIDVIDKVIDVINKLNFEYMRKKPILVQVENEFGDRMCIGVGNCAGYSVIDFLPCNSYFSKSVEGENIGDGVICFYMEDYESEFCISNTIQYDTAINVLKTFICKNMLDKSVNWIDD